MEDSMFNLNKALLCIIMSALAVGTTQPMDWGWLTTRSICESIRNIGTHYNAPCTASVNAALKKVERHKGVIAGITVAATALTTAGYMLYCRAEAAKQAQAEAAKQATQELEGILKSYAEGQSPLCWKTIKELIDAGANVDAAHDGWTVLHLAVADENINMVKYLCKKGADPEIKNNHQRSAKDDARLIQNPTPGLLINTYIAGDSNQAVIESELFQSELDKIYRQNRINFEDWKAIQNLIDDEVVLVDHCVQQYNNTFWKAIENFINEDVVPVDQGAQHDNNIFLDSQQINLNPVTDSALYVAIEKECLEMVNWLIENGANVHSFPQGMRDDNLTPIVFAAQKQNQAIYDALVNAGADPKQRDSKTGKAASEIMKGKEKEAKEKE